MRISPHYALHDFAQPALLSRSVLGMPYPEDCVDPWLVRLCVILERLRLAFDGREVLVLSGYRSPVYNLATGRRPPEDEHSQGWAADVVVQGVSPDDTVLTLLSLADEIPLGGLGRYRSCTHIDVRPLKVGEGLVYWEADGLPVLLSEATVCTACLYRTCRCGEIQIGEDAPALAAREGT